jgi:hypothetical protein
MTMMIYTYAVYIIVNLLITVGVVRTLNKNGRVFLVENFKGNEGLADLVNHLFLVGFYLINIGFVFLALRYGEKPNDAVEAIEFLSTKLGLVVVVLGGMHFYNMRMLTRFQNSKFFKALAPHQGEAVAERASL